MNRFWEKVEEINGKLIWPALMALLLIIIYELFLHIENHRLEIFIEVLDILVITIFVIDLIFLGVRAKNTRYFFKHYWLDLLAVFPFGLLIGMFERLYLSFFAAERVVVSQAILHEGLEARRELRLFQGERFGKVLRGIPRLLRLVTKGRAIKSSQVKKT